jgi:hypothetical protein
MLDPSTPHSQFLSSWIGLEALGWIYWYTWFRRAKFFVGVITLCRASLPVVLRTYVISHMVMCLESVCISWPWDIYHFTVLNMAVSQLTTSHIFRGKSRIPMHGVPRRKIHQELRLIIMMCTRCATLKFWKRVGL